MRYRVNMVERTSRTGHFHVEADSPEEAAAKADKMLVKGDDCVEWAPESYLYSTERDSVEVEEEEG